MGSDETSDALTAGEINYANDITLIYAARQDHKNKNYGGNQILIVAPYPDPSQRPIGLVDGVTGYGYLGGAGVRGLGCPVDGPHGPGTGAGTGGHGVVGHGGTGDLDINDDPQFSVRWKTYDPGFGVVGIGGWWTGPQTASNPLRGNTQNRTGRGGPGVVGVAGGENGSPPVPTFDQVKGVGVFGGSLVGEGMVADGAVAGLRATGDVGVWAIGTTAGIEAEGGTGMYAKGTSVGIEVEGGTGIKATGRGGPAGVFERPIAVRERLKYELIEPQIHIEPLPMWVPDPQDAQTVSVLPDYGVGDQLPRWANAGDLLMTEQGPIKDKPEIPPRPEATLWLCVVSGKENENAVWKQVLLGPPIEGKNAGKG
jgi:hypothetical protein